jgi:lycopene beta-cyclase
MPPEPIAPYALRLVRSSDVFAHLEALLKPTRIEWLKAAARSISRRSDGVYEVVTDAGTLHARWVFDSAPEIGPTFPSSHRPRALLSGTGIRVRADRPVFDAGTATLFDPLDDRSFAYLLPLSPSEALLESASFGPVAQEEDRAPLLQYLGARHPTAHFTVGHAEFGAIPLGFALSRTAGSRHVLLGAKRGLVKPSAGYGVVRIAEESERLGRLWRGHWPLPPSRQGAWYWRLLDRGFLQLAARDSRLPVALLHHVMGVIPLAQSLRFIDEELPVRQLGPLLRSASPVMLRKP